MSDYPYLKRLFRAYYKEKRNKRNDIPEVNSFNQREFGFLSWDVKSFMKRSLSFQNQQTFTKALIDNAPRHVYSSGALYKHPDNTDMDLKGYLGCDLIIDIDVDHFYTPCKDKHDLWWCKECDASGKGMIKKCPKCGKLKIKKITWICDECLDIAKKEILKLIYDFFIPDFKMNEEDMKIAFSGHRGYHLKVENENLRKLKSEDRREIADYVSGDNISLDILGLRQVSRNIYGLSKENIGWSQKIMVKLEDVLSNYTNQEIEDLLLRSGIKTNTINSFMNYKKDFLEVITTRDTTLWSIEGFGLKTWETFLKGIIGEIGAEIDEPVTIDIHRLIRYPGSLHGKSGFKTQELTIEELKTYNPLNESRSELDPIVFKSDTTQKLEILESLVPETKIKGETYGPYKQGEIIEVPHHIAVFLLCKDVAKTV